VDSPISLKKQWVLTKESLDVFLARLDPDEDRAGQKYEVIRLKLVKNFQWGRLVAAEEAACAITRSTAAICATAREKDSGIAVSGAMRAAYGAEQ